MFRTHKYSVVKMPYSWHGVCQQYQAAERKTCTTQSPVCLNADNQLLSHTTAEGGTANSTCCRTWISARLASAIPTYVQERKIPCRPAAVAGHNVHMFCPICQNGTVLLAHMADGTAPAHLSSTVRWDTAIYEGKTPKLRSIRLLAHFKCPPAGSAGRSWQAVARY